MPHELVQAPGLVDLHKHAYWLSDNFADLDPSTPAPVYAADGTLAVAAEPGNPITLTTGGTDNNPASLKMLRKPLKFQDGKGQLVESKILLTEATTAGQLNFFFGHTEETAINNMIADNGAGPTADWHGSAFYGVDGESNLRCISSVGTTKTNTILDGVDLNNLSRIAQPISSAAWREFKIETRAHSAGKNEVVFWIDDVIVASHVVATAGAVQTGAAIGIKTGSGNAQSAKVQYLNVAQAR